MELQNKRNTVEIIDLPFTDSDVVSATLSEVGIRIVVRLPKRVEDLPQGTDDLMRIFVNKIIDRVFEDRKQGIYH